MLLPIHPKFQRKHPTGLAVMSPFEIFQHHKKNKGLININIIILQSPFSYRMMFQKQLPKRDLNHLKASPTARKKKLQQGSLHETNPNKAFLWANHTKLLNTFAACHLTTPFFSLIDLI